MCQKTTVDCTPYKCKAGVPTCPTSCMASADCIKDFMCTLPEVGVGLCLPKL
jgi:hypothetical protein